MAKEQKPSPILKVIRNAASSEEAAYAFLEAQRWGSEPACPRCGVTDVYQMRGRDGQRHKHYRWRCRGCSKMFSVRTGTVLEESRLPLRVWVHAFWRANASKKGVSALQLSRECGITHKSALFLLHRIRLAMATDPESAPKLSGDVEADETYVGGRPRHRQSRDKWDGKKLKVGRGTDKAPVFAVVERGGNVRASTIPSVNKNNLYAELRASVDLENARLLTDEFRLYNQIGREFGQGHEKVKHGKHEYVRGDVHTNTVEGFFALLKRGIYGTFHSVSRHHLHRYVSEFEFRYNHRKDDDAQRTLAALRGAEGKRLYYRQPSSVV